MPSLKDLRKLCISDVKRKLSCLPDDSLIIRVVKSLDEVSRVVKVLGSRFDDWSVFYSYKKRDKVLSDFERQLVSLRGFQKKLDAYLISLMRHRCPHLTSVASHVIGARLIAASGSLEKLARMPSSKIQVLGAEKALFRHLKTGSRPPKFGVIYFHGSVLNSPDKGKAARHLASRIAIAARQDFYGKAL
ncbi:MAG: hypothetical protein ABIH63_03900 [archaeon]